MCSVLLFLSTRRFAELIFEGLGYSTHISENVSNFKKEIKKFVHGVWAGVRGGGE